MNKGASAVRAKVEREELAHMLRDRRMTHQEIAGETGLTVSGVRQAVRRYGLAKPRLSHKWALPWRLKQEHSMGAILSYLRYLSSAAQHKKSPAGVSYQRRTVGGNLIAQGLDVDYDREVSPEDSISFYGGFYTKPAPGSPEKPQDWHLKYVLDKAGQGDVKNL